MKKSIFKPSFAKILLTWFIIVTVLMILVTIAERPDLTDPLAVILFIVFVVVRTLIMAAVFYLIPYFRIEVNDTHVAGPGSPWGPGWHRVNIPLAAFDARNVKATIPWLGFHKITSAESGTITVWWFDTNGIRKLLEAVAQRRAATG